MSLLVAVDIGNTTVLVLDGLGIIHERNKGVVCRRSADAERRESDHG